MSLKATQTIVHSEANDVVKRLEELGLTHSLLLKVLEQAERERMICGPLHPRNSPGMYFWAGGTASLRGALIPLGWKARNERGLATAINLKTKIQIMVTSGDEETGLSEGEPLSKSRKGPVVSGKVRVNKQMNFLEILPEDQGSLMKQFMKSPKDPVTQEQKRRIAKTLRATKDKEVATWVLLISSTYNPWDTDGEEHVLRSELSLPNSLSESGKFDGFTERIILDPIRMNEDPVSRINKDEDLEDEIEIEVTRIN